MAVAARLELVLSDLVVLLPLPSPLLLLMVVLQLPPLLLQLKTAPVRRRWRKEIGRRLAPSRQVPLSRAKPWQQRAEKWRDRRSLSAPKLGGSDETGTGLATVFGPWTVRRRAVVARQ